MQNLMLRISLFSIASLIAISLPSCGTSKVKECNSIGEVTKDMKAAADEIEASTTSKNAQIIIQAMISVSGKTDKLSKDMKALTIADEKLVGLQSQFVKLYQDNSKGMADTAKGLQTKNKAMADTAIAKMTEGDKQEAIMIKNLNDYCGWTEKDPKSAPDPKK